ncbi:MAG: CsbD family protein [Candidatus Dormibacteria bacterium]
MSGRSDKVAGKVKELSGKVTGDEDLEAEGKSQRLVGKVERAGEEARDSVRGAARAVKTRVRALTKHEKVRK